MSRLSRADAVFGIGSFLVFVSMFFPWYTVSVSGILGTSSGSASGSGFNAGGWRYLIVLLAFAGMGYVILKAIGVLPKLPLPNWQVMGIIAGLNVLLVLLGFLTKPSGGGLFDVVYHTGWGFGLFFALVVSLAALGGAYWDKIGAPPVR